MKHINIKLALKANQFDVLKEDAIRREKYFKTRMGKRALKLISKYESTD